MIVFLGFVAFQVYGYHQYCIQERRPWCEQSIPLLYQFVQQFYWWVIGHLLFFKRHRTNNFGKGAMVFLRIMKSSRYLISCWRPQSFWYHAMEFGVIFHLTSRDFWRLEWKAPMVRCDVWHRGLKSIFSTTAITRSTHCKRSERWCYSRDVYNKWFLVEQNVASHIPVDYFSDHC